MKIISFEKLNKALVFYLPFWVEVEL